MGQHISRSKRRDRAFLSHRDRNGEREKRRASTLETSRRGVERQKKNFQNRGAERGRRREGWSGSSQPCLLSTLPSCLLIYIHSSRSDIATIISSSQGLSSTPTSSFEIASPIFTLHLRKYGNDRVSPILATPSLREPIAATGRRYTLFRTSIRSTTPFVLLGRRQTVVRNPRRRLAFPKEARFGNPNVKLFEAQQHITLGI